MTNLIPSQYLVVASTVIAVIMGFVVMTLRARAAKKPASVKKIIIPPIAMSTGALMFVSEYFRVHGAKVLEACVVGMIFSTVLIATSKFEIRGKDIYLKQSKAFIFILVGLLIVRLIGKIVLSGSIDVGELSGMFWLLAFSMIVPWRIAMLVKFKRLEKQI